MDLQTTNRLLSAFEELLSMNERVLTENQLDHPQCGKTIRQAIGPAKEILAKARTEAAMSAAKSNLNAHIAGEMLASLEALKSAIDIARDYDGDVFGAHHNEAEDAQLLAKSTIAKARAAGIEPKLDIFPDLLEALEEAEWMLKRDPIDADKRVVIEKCQVVLAAAGAATIEGKYAIIGDLRGALEEAKDMLERDHIDDDKLTVIEKCDEAIAKARAQAAGKEDAPANPLPSLRM